MDYCSTEYPYGKLVFFFRSHFYIVSTNGLILRTLNFVTYIPSKQFSSLYQVTLILNIIRQH